MLLVIDIGNTAISFGLFVGKRLVGNWRLGTKDADHKGIGRILKGRTVDGVCVSSVVPQLNLILRRAIKKHLGCKTLFVSAKNSGIKIPRYNKKRIGTDRLVNAVAAYAKYKRPCIVIDLGTATTFDYVTRNGEFGGGIIAPGIGTINDALSNATAKLPKVPIGKTKRVIAQNTKHSMQSGVFHGYVGLTEHLIDKMKKETGTKPKVIATGGLANVIAKSSKSIEAVNPFLTLEGLRIIWDKNK